MARQRVAGPDGRFRTTVRPDVRSERDAQPDCGLKPAGGARGHARPSGPLDALDQGPDSQRSDSGSAGRDGQRSRRCVAEGGAKAFIMFLTILEVNLCTKTIVL